MNSTPDDTYRKSGLHPPGLLTLTRPIRGKYTCLRKKPETVAFLNRQRFREIFKLGAKMQEIEFLVQKYVEEPVWAVVGASNDRAKYGNRIYRKLKSAGYLVYPVNRREHTIEGNAAYATLLDLPEPPAVVNMVVPPQEAPSVVQQAKKVGAQAVWFQPGAESPDAIHWAREHGLDVIESCILVQLALRPPSFKASSGLPSERSPRNPSPDPATSTR